MRAHVVHDLVNANLLNVLYVASQDNAADAVTKGWGATSHRKARLLLSDRAGATSKTNNRGT
eukprot:7004265-Prorocentrum_lima.AAC.1